MRNENHLCGNVYIKLWHYAMIDPLVIIKYYRFGRHVCIYGYGNACMDLEGLGVVIVLISTLSLSSSGKHAPPPLIGDADRSWNLHLDFKSTHKML